MSSMKGLRWLLLLSGILVIILGVYMLTSPLATLVSLAVYIGVTILVSGIAEIAGYFSTEKTARSGWVLTSGILSTLFGIWTLFGSGTEALTIALPFIFAVWVLSSGIMRIVGSFTLKSEGSRNWGWMLAFGILSALAGFSLMFNPLLSALYVSYIVAFMFIFHGINNVVLFWALRKS